MSGRKPSRVDMSPAAVTARLRWVSAVADLRPERRLDAKLDMSPAGITRRLRESAALLELGRRLGAAGRTC